MFKIFAENIQKLVKAPRLNFINIFISLIVNSKNLHTFALSI